MTEQFILDFIPRRMAQLGYKRYHIRYRDLTLQPAANVLLAAFNELFFIVGDPPGILVESSYGIYDTADFAIEENVHQHRGEIVINNPDATDYRRIKFIQVIIID